MRDVLAEAKEKGEANPVILRVPEQNVAFLSPVPPVTFPYQCFPHPTNSVFGPGHNCWRPLVITTIASDAGSSFRCITWPDSGADHCVFPVSFAKAIGLDTLQMPKETTQGVGGTSVTYYANLTIDLGMGISFKTLARFTPAWNPRASVYWGKSVFLRTTRSRSTTRRGFFLVERQP